MSLPQSVQAQAEAAAKHFEAKPENTEADPAATPGEGEQNPQGSTPSTEPAPDGGHATQPADKPASSEPEQEPKPASQEEQYWQHRFKVLQGKYDKELPALRSENEELKQQVANQDSRVKDLEKQSPTDSNAGVSDDQLDQFKQEFGEDLVTFVERMVSQRQSGSAQPTREMQERLDRLESEKDQDAQARFWMELEQAVPNFREINADPAFHQFLASYDPQSGAQRQQTLTEAQQRMDPKGVADIFRLHLSQAGQAERRAIPDEQVEPRTTRVTDAPQGKHQWTRGEIGQFYRDKNSGRYSAEEAERLEADIFAAQTEGRVR